MTLLALALALPLLSARADDDLCDDPGATSVLAHMPQHDPSWPPTGATYPEGVALVGNRVIVSGPANFGTAGNGSPSQLTVFDRVTGELRAEVPLTGENLDYEHALSELAEHGQYVYAPSTQLGVLRWRFKGNTDTPTQESVSTPFCSVTLDAPCHVDTTACPADIRPYLPPLPNGITVDDNGDTYVTDSLQGIVWKVPASKTLPVAPEVLACSPALQGIGPDGLYLFGANGVAVVDNHLYVGVTFAPPDAVGVPTSTIYRMPKAGGALAPVYTFSGVEVAPGVVVPPILDGLRYDEETDTLLAVLGGQAQVVELDLSEDPLVEVNRYGRVEAEMPFVAPSTVAVGEDGETYVVNHAILACLEGDPSPTCTSYDASDLFGVIELCRE